MTLRVLHLAAGNMYGGVERILVTLARLKSESASVDHQFGICFQGRLVDELRVQGATVHILGGVRFSRPWTVWQARRTLSKLVSKMGFDVIICHSAWPYALFGSVARSNLIPTVFWLHNRTTADHWTEKLAGRTTPDLVLAVSKSTAETAGALFSKAKTEVFYSPLPMISLFDEPFDPVAVRRELDTDPESVVIIQASRMEDWKGHMVHLDALSRMRDRHDWTCWIAGGAQVAAEKEYLQRLRNFVAEKQLDDRVRFLGDRSDIPKLLRAANIFCQPNLASEGFSIAFMEAFCARLPIITGRIGGGMEIVDETCGRLVSPGSVEETVNSLNELIDSRSLRDRLGNAGRVRVIQMCDPAAQMKKLSLHLHRVCERKA